jgi:hypothetical protein
MDGYYVDSPVPCWALVRTRPALPGDRQGPRARRGKPDSTGGGLRLCYYSHPIVHAMHWPGVAGSGQACCTSWSRNLPDRQAHPEQRPVQPVLNAALGWWADPLAGYVLAFYAAREVGEVFFSDH